jgi:hypothetical protein
MSSVLYVNTTSLLRLVGLRDRDGDLVLAATVELTELNDRNGDAVTGISLPLSLAAVGDGSYEGEIPETVDVAAGDTLKARVVATFGALVATFFERVLVREHSE